MPRRPALGRPRHGGGARRARAPPARRAGAARPRRARRAAARPLAAALGGALREERVVRLVLAPLSEAEAAELVGPAAAKLYAASGGNPFYLEQLARARDAPDAGAGLAADGAIPPAVAASLAAELAGLAPEARRLLDGAAVAGDPFDPGLAAAVAELPDDAALLALDELLQRALVRPAGAPRQFAFRHPVVRHAVYVAAPGGWRLGAHGRAAAALARRGAGPVQRAHHVEHAASPGDEAAIAVLVAAAEELQSPAPATAARCCAAALRLVPDRPEERVRRTRLQLLLADAQAAAGDASAARETLARALTTAGAEERLALTVGLANQEWWLGGHEEARRRLYVALGDLPAEPSPDRIRLRLALCLTALTACELDEAEAQALDARHDAGAIGDEVFALAATAAGVLASALRSPGAEPARRLDASAAALERLTPGQLATRLPALWMHGRARRALGRFEAALADLRRGAALAADTGRERVLLILTIERVAPLIELGRLAEAAATAEEGLELARLGENPRMLLWAHSARSSAALAAGDVAAALSAAGEAVELGARADVYAAGQPGWSLGAALTAAGNPDQAIPALLDGFGGEALPGVLPADRPAAAADLIEARLALGDLDGAAATLERARAAVGDVVGGAAGDVTAWPTAVVALAAAGVLLARARPDEALVTATAARQAASEAPLLRARARLAEGRALAAAGERAAGIAALIEAEAALHGFGAIRRRDEAVRELRRLGHRVVRPAGEGAAEDPLTAREREIAALVGAGRTNREVAEQLVLSTRTIEAHLRSIYGKLGVRSRVELAREIGSRAAS